MVTDVEGWPATPWREPAPVEATMDRARSGRWDCPLALEAAGIVALALLVVSAGSAGAEHAAPVGPQLAWQARLVEVEAALSRNDLEGAEMRWLEAYAAALRSRHWEGMVAAADAYRRLGVRGNFPSTATDKTREIYLAALFRARQAGSVDGVLKVAEAFTDLGDQEVVRRCIDIARAMAVKGRDAEGQERVLVFARRWAARRFEVETQEEVGRTAR